jgi:hypothetical protein
MQALGTPYIVIAFSIGVKQLFFDGQAGHGSN